MNRLKIYLATAAAVSALSGCAVAPAPHETLSESVTRSAPDAWQVDAPQSALDTDTWWNGFGDPVLHRLIAAVLSGNLDARAAAERIEQAEALERRQRAELAPELDATANAANARQNVPPPLGYVREAGAGVTASWQPDGFGGQRLAVLAAEAQRDGRRDGLDEVRLALAGQTAAAYIELRWAQNALRIAHDNLAIRSRALQLAQSRLQYGLATQLEVARAQSALDELQGSLPGLETDVQHQLSLIAIYLGQAPESLDTLPLAQPAPVPVPAQGLPAVLPSVALLRRPDVREAYDTVRARAAEVGQARAERYPRFSLNLSDGVLAASYLGLPALTDNLFSAALSATSPIFDAGRIAADIDAKQSSMREAQLELRQTILRALKDVEDARQSLAGSNRQVESLSGAQGASQDSVRLSIELYKGGTTSFLDVLDAQEALLRDSEGLNDARRDRALAAVALYRALGGAWHAGAVPAAAA